MQHSIEDFVAKIDVMQRKAELLADAAKIGLTKADPTVNYLIEDIQALALEIAKDREQ